MTSTESKPAETATPTPVVAQVPSFKEVPRPVATGAGRAKEPNFYENVLADLPVDIKGFSTGREFEAKEGAHTVHVNMIRRAAKVLGKGVSVVVRDSDKAGHKIITFAVQPKRVVNTKTDKVETPAESAPESTEPVAEPVAEPVKAGK